MKGERKLKTFLPIISVTSVNWEIRSLARREGGNGEVGGGGRWHVL